MIKDGKGGGITKRGLHFENKVDLKTLFLQMPNYTTIDNYENKAGYTLFYKNKVVARGFKKYDFYKFLDEYNVNYNAILSKKLLPDDALLVIVRDTLFIIEVKYQEVAGSTDEKLQTCDFKRKQYMKLVHSLGLNVSYIYVLNDWFDKLEYKDVLDYIVSVNCSYVFNKIPLAWLGLPEE